MAGAAMQPDKLKGKKNLCGCTEKANEQWTLVGFLLSSYVEPAISEQRLRLQIDWRQKGPTFQFNLFLWVILRILHSA